MAKVNDEQLNAYLDGELPESEANEIERAVAANDKLSVRLDQLAKVDVLFRGAVDRLEASAESSASTAPSTTDTSPVERSKPLPPAANDNWWRLAITASVALAVGLFAGGTMFNFDQNAGDSIRLASYESSTEFGGLLERGASGDALEIKGGSAQVQLTFVGLEGRPCREFRVIGAELTTFGVACRGSAPQWNVEIAAVSPNTRPTDPSVYQTASAGGEAFSYAVSAMMQSDPLNAEDEQALIEKSWKP